MVGGSGAHLDIDKARQAAGLGPPAAGKYIRNPYYNLISRDVSDTLLVITAAPEGVVADGPVVAPAALRTTIFEGGVPYDRLHQGYQLRRPSIIDFRNFTDKVKSSPLSSPALTYLVLPVLVLFLLCVLSDRASF